MAFALNDAMITPVQFSIGLLDNARPYFLRVLAFRKDKLVLVIHRKLVIDNYVNFFEKFVETDHVCAFLVVPDLALGWVAHA